MEWYSYNGFKFSQEQIRWALSYLPMLRDGQWPPEHKSSGYVGEAHGKHIKTEGNFVKASSIAGEIDLRLTRAGLDGLLLELLYANEPDDEVFVIQHIAMALGEDIWTVNKRIENALKYVSGSGRKKSYKDFLGHRKADE